MPQRIIDELRYQLMDAVNGTCAAPTMVCFDPARVDVDPATAAALLPPWLANATAAEVVERPARRTASEVYRRPTPTRRRRP